jgi:hypothetical protein
MAPLHSLVDGLKMKNRCRPKEGGALRHYYIKKFEIWMISMPYIETTYGTFCILTICNEICHG